MKKKINKHTFVQLNIHRPPPYIVLARLLIHDTLVLRTAASLLPREIDERAGGGDDRALVADRILVEKSGRGVAPQLDLVHVEAGLREVVELVPED